MHSQKALWFYNYKINVPDGIKVDNNNNNNNYNKNNNDNNNMQ